MLKTIPGIGDILVFTIMLEVGGIGRFPKVWNYSSYCRCVKSEKISNKKKKGVNSCRFTWFLNEDGPLVNKPSGVGPRFILAHAITENGWVDGAQLVFEAKKRTGDYHGQMNWENFSTWFKTQIVSEYSIWGYCNPG